LRISDAILKQLSQGGVTYVGKISNKFTELQYSTCVYTKFDEMSETIFED